MPEVELEIKEIHDEAKGVKTFVVERPENFSFLPGQYCWLRLPNFQPTPMAIASGIDEPHLLFSIRSWGSLTLELFKRTAGDTVLLDGPHGTSFPLDRLQEGGKLYMVASGTGITPIRSLTFSANAVDKTVFYGAKYADELLYRYNLEHWPAEVHLTVYKEKENWEGRIGFVTGLLADRVFEQGSLFFICGSWAMEQAVVELLRTKGIPDSNIYISLERFDDQGNVVGPVLPVNDELVNL